MSQFQPVDAADEAGGEAIFSSEGLPALPTPRTPKVASSAAYSTGDDDEDGDVLDTGASTVDPSNAVKIFSGPKEAPQQRLLRLKREVAELEQDLNTEEVAKLASQLSSHLAYGVHPRDDLVKLMKDHNTRQQQNTSGKAEEGNVVYELYGGSVPASSPMEERLLKLEQTVGGLGATAPLTQRVKEMENKVQRLNDKSIEEFATRAKVIRSDLEAASKARSKLNSTTSSTDSKMISELYTQLQQLEGLSAHLPGLTHRLQQLAHLHVQGANFAGRLGSAESSIVSIQGTLASMETAIGNLEETMTQNVQTMDANLKKLEERTN